MIGGIAAGAHGSPTPTLDIDICYDRSPGNLERLAAVLGDLEAGLRGVDEDVPFLLGAEILGAGDHFTLTTELGDLDLLGTPAGTDGYQDLAKDAVAVELGGREVRLASLDALIRMKEAVGRRKDRLELEILGALRDELDGKP